MNRLSTENPGPISNRDFIQDTGDTAFRSLTFRKKSKSGRSALDRIKPFAVPVLALLGIPASGFIALALLVQISKFIYGQAILPLFALEVLAIFSLLILVIALRFSLNSPRPQRAFSGRCLIFSRCHVGTPR